ncbi:MAG: hypothetical protein KF833_19385 [Verrucomicrobiae bacterium]|nr:hypothetical protein [Verrucomicrobiae bacterium]
MKVLCSEVGHDYGHYLYPYVLWGYLEPGETPADALASGFMPGTPEMDRWYMVRQIRVGLEGWAPSSENRRVLRRTEGWRCELVEKGAFGDTAERRAGWLEYAAGKWGVGIMTPERLDRLMGGPVVSHLFHCTEGGTGEEVGSALVYCEPPRAAFYYYAFYRRTPETKHYGMGMMARAVAQFAAAGYEHLYLGTCYSERALYKAQFEPLEFWNGCRWSGNGRELRHLVRQGLPEGRHRLETAEFRDFQPGPLAELARESCVRIDPAIRPRPTRPGRGPAP